MNNVLLFISLFVLMAAQFGGADSYTWVSLFLVPICSAVSWFAGRRQRNNDTIQKMQATINMLAEKNNELYAKIVEQSDQIANLSKQLTEVRRENAELKAGQERISNENAGLKRQLDVIKKGKQV